MVVLDFLASRVGIFLIAVTAVVALQVWLFHFSGKLNHTLKGVIFFGLLGVIYYFLVLYFKAAS